MKKAILILLAVLLNTGSFSWAGGQAMFGLNWGMSPAEVREFGIYLKPEKKTNNLYIYSTNSLPKNLKGTGSYTLVFSKQGKLIKIIMVGEKITGDLSGEIGKARFEELASQLSQKYKEFKSITEVGVKMYDEPDEFYQCLAYKGCGLWVKMFQAENQNISLQLNGVRKGEGYLDITIEAVPEWNIAVGKEAPVVTVEDKEAL